MKTKIAVLKKLLKHQLTNSQAATMLKLSLRQIIRLKQRYLQDGSTGLIHRLTGKNSNNSKFQTINEIAIDIVHREFSDFGPTLASEHLWTDYNLKVNRESLRQVMIKHNLWKDRKRKAQQYRQKRIPRSSYGEMIQYDGSYEHWLEDRGGTGEICLLMGVDDARSEIQSIYFTTDEGTKCTFAFWKEYLLKHGKPLQIYLDNFSTYKSILIESALDREAKTQFGRAMAQLRIEVIFANSPQAKGRIERRFGNLQDRLIKEMRLAGIDSIEEANKYANQIFIPWFNKRFGKAAKTTQNLHQRLTEQERENLDSTLSIQYDRVIQNDFTVRHSGQYYQMQETEGVSVFKQDKVIVEEWLNGETKIRLKNRCLDYKILTQRPYLTKAIQKKLLLPRKITKPNTSHPFKRRSYQRYLSKLSSKK